MNSTTKPIDPTRCPLCGGPNDCQLCSMDAYKGPCWCVKMEVPESLLALLPPDAKDRSCICRGCITAFQRANRAAVSTSRPDLNPE